ncbi:MAG: ATP-binding protein [Clostridia bacterium]|nr:ATP-binding protein [Clostridia bacterium]
MMENIKLHYDVDSNDFSCAGEASGKIKKALKDLGFDASLIRNVAIAVYEGEINMVIHADGGVIDAEISPEKVTVVLKDRGPGIPDIEQAMTEGFSTAPENVRALGFGAGMGLPNIKKYSDTMHIDTEIGVGTTITLTFNF